MTFQVLLKVLEISPKISSRIYPIPNAIKSFPNDSIKNFPKKNKAEIPLKNPENAYSPDLIQWMLQEFLQRFLLNVLEKCIQEYFKNS